MATIAGPSFTSSEFEMVSRVPLLTGLHAEEVDEITGQLRRHRYRSNEVIYHEGDTAGGLFILLQGKVKMCVGQAGKRLTAQLISEGNCFGLHSLLDSGPRLTDAIAVKPSEVAIWGRESFLTFVWSHPVVAKAALDRMASQYRAAMTRYYDMALLNIPCRVAKVLLRYAEAFPNGREPSRANLSLVELAALVGATRQSVSKVLTFFEHQEWINVERGYITVSNPRELANFQLRN